MITAAQRAGSKSRLETSVPLFMCPSRRGAGVYSFTNPSNYFNADRPANVGRNDYAGCAGNLSSFVLFEGPPLSGSAMPDPWEDVGSYADYTVPVERPGRTPRPPGNGVILALSQTRIAEITDGTSNTFFAGEKYIPAGEYDTSAWIGNDQGWDQGFDHDVIRWTKFLPENDSSQLGISANDAVTIFGSAHPAGCQMVLCDGSVTTVSYSADLTVFQAMGSIADDEIVDRSAL